MYLREMPEPTNKNGTLLAAFRREATAFLTSSLKFSPSIITVSRLYCDYIIPLAVIAIPSITAPSKRQLMYSSRPSALGPLYLRHMIAEYAGFNEYARY